MPCDALNERTRLCRLSDDLRTCDANQVGQVKVRLLRERFELLAQRVRAAEADEFILNDAHGSVPLTIEHFIDFILGHVVKSVAILAQANACVDMKVVERLLHFAKRVMPRKCVPNSLALCR